MKKILMQKSCKNILILIAIILVSGCTSVSYETIYPTLQDGKYDSEFPYKSTSDELRKISETVQRVNSTAFYKIYVFDEKHNFTLDDLKNKKLNQIAIKEAWADNSTSGTAVIVYSQNGNIALLTCAHPITFPDTLIAYRFDEVGYETKYVESISIKEKQVIYVAGFPEDSQVEVLAQDNKLDIALIGRKFSPQRNILFPAFSYPLGKAKEVDWGTFVYLVGYPINFKIITKAIISSPRRDDAGSFLVDAVINPGFSGGLVLAIRDGVPNFELVGMVQWVPEEEENLIYPENLKTKSSYNPVVPYTGNLYVRKHSSIRYGIAKVIPIESIVIFLIQNKLSLNQKGYYIFDK
ncbi:MAG: serine protease [Ignavibacteria bacterium]|nr:serine protease [Ignavibacteria bacterium]